MQAATTRPSVSRGPRARTTTLSVEVAAVGAVQQRASRPWPAGRPATRAARGRGGRAGTPPRWRRGSPRRTRLAGPTRRPAGRPAPARPMPGRAGRPRGRGTASGRAGSSWSRARAGSGPRSGGAETAQPGNACQDRVGDVGQRDAGLRLDQVGGVQAVAGRPHERQDGPAVDDQRLAVAVGHVRVEPGAGVLVDRGRRSRSRAARRGAAASRPQRPRGRRGRHPPPLARATASRTRAEA